MKQQFTAVLNITNAQGMPAGGYVNAGGLDIRWQEGPLGRGDTRKIPNGAFVETVIAAALQRIEHYQVACERKFACRENEMAINTLDEALRWLGARTKAREERGVEGTHDA